MSSRRGAKSAEVRNPARVVGGALSPTVQADFSGWTREALFNLNVHRGVVELLVSREDLTQRMCVAVCGHADKPPD